MRSSAERNSSALHHIAPPLFAAVILVVAWAVAVRFSGIAPYLLPSPLKVWHAFGELQATVKSDVVTTMTEAVFGLAIGAIAGAVIAFALWSHSFSRRAVMPLLVVSQTVPMVVLAPLLVLWFGLGLAPKVIVVALTTFFPVAVATVQGLLNTSKELIDLTRTMNASRWFTMRKVLIPSAMPSFFSGLRIGASYAVAGAVIGEWVGATSGLGLLLARAQRSFRIDRVFVAVAVIAFFSVVLYVLVDQISRLAMPWQRTNEGKKE